MIISSPAFQNNQEIPSKYSCYGEDINPPLIFSDIPLETQSLALIVEDPDAVSIPNFTHWVLGNISPIITQISENSVPENCVVGVNDFGESKYGGPCPPNGTHRYFFRLYALDTTLDLSEATTKEYLQGSMENHLLASSQLVGLYTR